MDLLDFKGQDLYFDEAIAPQVEQLLKTASESYAEGKAEPMLLKAYALAPTNLTVLVALYRFYYYQHRYAQALEIAWRAMQVSGERLRLPDSWKQLTTAHMGAGALQSMGLLRFYLLALKGAAYLCLRMGRFAESAAMLKKLVDLDPHDRLGAKALLVFAEPYTDDDDGARLAVG